MFHFINYCSPNWYFNSIKLQNYHSYLLNYDELSPNDKLIIEFDNNYSSREISLLDASFQGLKKGLIIKGGIQQLDYKYLEPTISDNYRFIKKYYGFPWSLFVFLIRLLSLKNPIIEIIGFLSNLNVKRIRLFDSFNKNNLGEFESSLVKSMPKVSIIIPTLNR